MIFLILISTIKTKEYFLLTNLKNISQELTTLRSNGIDHDNYSEAIKILKNTIFTIITNKNIINSICTPPSTLRVSRHRTFAKLIQKLNFKLSERTEESLIFYYKIFKQLINIFSSYKSRNFRNVLIFLNFTIKINKEVEILLLNYKNLRANATIFLDFKITKNIDVRVGLKNFRDWCLGIECSWEKIIKKLEKFRRFSLFKLNI